MGVSPFGKGEAVKKLPPFERVAKDIEKVLQRNLFMLITHDEKL